jgi:hypothetical protein
VSFARKLAAALAILGGASPLPEGLSGRTSVAVLRGLYWTGLLLIVWAFAGRATKFIYIDF